MNYPMPSDEICAAVAKSAEAAWNRMVEIEALKYERGRLQKLGVLIPPLTLHDYSLTATRIVVEAIKLHTEGRFNFWRRERAIGADGGMGPTAMYHMAPLCAALQVEQARLDKLERRAA